MRQFILFVMTIILIGCGYSSGGDNNEEQTDSNNKTVTKKSLTSLEISGITPIVRQLASDFECNSLLSL